MTRTPRRTTDERQDAAAQELFTSEGAPAAPSAADDLERRMKTLLVSFDGAQYLYNGFRYDHLADAMAYASLMVSRPQFERSNTLRAPAAFSPPTDAQRTLMGTLGVELVDRIYRFEGYRYDRLSDALAYARQSQAAPRRPDAG